MKKKRGTCKFYICKKKNRKNMFFPEIMRHKFSFSMTEKKNP